MTAHFEIHASDVEAAKAFYSGLFGWEFTAMPGAEEVQYHLASGLHFAPNTSLTLGLLKRMDAKPDNGSPVRGGTMTFEVSDCDSCYNWALANGGAEALPPTDFPGIGRCAYAEDGQGNIVGMITSTNGDASNAD